ncbi:transposase, partial [Pseudoalteromonas sp. S1649]|uniref:transposase n=1 Tax=Pseudoalteromonas sp. S1649 TaxID=579508 RepID=UPI001283FA38
MKVKSQRRYSLEFKIKVVQESLDTTDTVKMIANKYGIHPDMLSSWRSHMTSKKKTAKPLKNQGPDKSYADLERQIRKLEKQLVDA